MEFNINETVRVKLTPHGRKIHRQIYDDFWSRFPSPKNEYHPPLEDADGWSRWQLWCLMKEFGPHMGMTMEPCFDATIDIPAEERA